MIMTEEKIGIVDHFFTKVGVAAPVERVTVGDDVGIKVRERVRENDIVYKVTEDEV